MARSVSIALLASLALAPVAAAAPDAVSETDRFALDSAAAACADGEFAAFFRAFALSPAVRLKYAAPEIAVTTANGETRRVPRENYDGFPIATIDYYWVSADSAAAFEKDPDAGFQHVALEFNQGQNEVWSVEWVRVRYDGPSEDDELGNVVETIGAPGQLLFSPTDTCWALTDDITLTPPPN